MSEVIILLPYSIGTPELKDVLIFLLRSYFIEGTVNDLHGNRMKIKFDE